MTILTLPCTFRLDPVSTKEIHFRVLFDPDYSTACVVKISCDECSRFDPSCKDFVPSKMDALSEVNNGVAVGCVITAFI